jgi:TolB protein
MKIKSIVYFILFLLLAQTSAYAVLNLELTKGVDSSVPIAVVPFETQGNESPTVDISNIIASDLQNSGQFKLFDTEQMKQLPSRLSEVDFDYWRGLKINDLVIGDIQAEGGGVFRINFSLLDVYKNQINNNRSTSVKNTMGIILNSNINPVLVDKTYITKDKGLRKLGHNIADVIYQKLTGEKGIFSTKIAYVLVKRKQDYSAQYSLVVADADGYNQHAILVSPQPIMSPAWSPDGKQIAYVSFENRRASLFISTVATGKRRLVTRFPGINGAPAWSPDGKKLAIVLSRDDNTKIVTINLATGKLQQLTNGWSIDTEPKFSPDGKSIIFTSDRGGSPQIYRMNLANRQVKRITFSGNYNARASFTPDGENIIMLHRDNGLFDVAIQNLKTGVVTVLTGAGNDQSPSVAPNGKMIIYASHNEGRGVLGLVSTDGRVKLRLPESEGEVREPVWGP